MINISEEDYQFLKEGYSHLKIIEVAEKAYVDDYKEWFCCSYKLKDGEKIHVRAG